MSEWPRTSLGEIVDIKHGLAFKGEFFRDEPPGDILLTPGNFRIGGGFQAGKEKLYDGPVPEEYVLEEGDLLVTMTDLSRDTATLGYPALVPLSTKGRFLHNQRLGKVIVRDGVSVDKRFLYYLMCSRPYRHEVLASATGTTVKHTSPSRILQFEFGCPPFKAQQRIARILGTLDDKIELNRRVNRTLEATARAIFKSWFVDFDPVHAKAAGHEPVGMDPETAALFPDSFQDSPLGKIPKGWRAETLGDHVEITRGLSYKGRGLSDAGMPLHNLNSIYEGGGYKRIGIKFYEGDFKERHTTRPGDILVANTEQTFDLLLIGYPARVPACFGNEGIFSHHLYKMSLQDGSQLTEDYLYRAMLHERLRREVANYSNGTTVNMLPKDALQRPLLLVPDESVLKAFDERTEVLSSLTESLEDGAPTFARTRDALLPELLSGRLT